MRDHAVDGERANEASRSARLPSGLIGRDEEFAQLLAATEMSDGRTSGALVTGDPGMGKSALLEALASRATEAEVLRASCLELESAMPFAGLHQLLSPLLSITAELPQRQQEVLESALAIGPSVTHDEFAVAAATLGLLAAAIERGPLLLLVDDAQWIDSGSFDALMFAFRRLREEPVALVLGCRSRWSVPGVVAADFTEIVLGPLDTRSARSLVATQLATPGDDHATVDRLVALGGGVPLALIELARSPELVDTAPPALDNRGGAITSLVERLFGQRVSGLPPSVATAALLAALDDPGELDAFLRAGRTLGADRSAWVEAERLSLLQVRDGRVDFHHPLSRAAVLSAAAPELRRRAHLALAEALQARGDADRAVIHRAAGTIGSDETLAAELEQAAERHRGRAGHTAAARALVQASRLSPTAIDAARRLLLAADEARRGGEPERAVSLAIEVRRLSPDPLVSARAELLQAHIEARRGSTDAALARYQRVADQAASDPELAALALTYAASAAAVVGDMSEALRLALRADAVPAGALSEGAVIAVRETLGVTLALAGDAARAHPLLIEVADWYQCQPDRVGAEYIAEALTWLGDFARVRRLLDDLATDARALGATGLLIQTLALRADLGYRAGEWSSAIGDASEAVGLAEDSVQPVLLAYSLASLAILEAATGAAGARERAERAAEGGREHGLGVVEESASFAIAAVELAAGNPEAAVVQLERVAARAADGGRGEPAMSLWPAELIEALLAVDRREDAEAALRRLDGQAARTGGRWALGVAARYRGLLADEAAFDASFTTAIDHHEASGMPFELARTRYCYGQRLRRAGRRVAARMEFRQALATFHDLGAADWVARAERELAGSGERQRPAATSDRDTLTSQELQIARLIAAGATNREAAADLFLSPKTIETHLTRVYRKLGVRSRSELAHHMSSNPGTPTEHHQTKGTS